MPPPLPPFNVEQYFSTREQPTNIERGEGAQGEEGWRIQLSRLVSTRVTGGENSHEVPPIPMTSPHLHYVLRWLHDDATGRRSSRGFARQCRLLHFSCGAAYEYTPAYGWVYL